MAVGRTTPNPVGSEAVGRAGAARSAEAQDSHDRLNNNLDKFRRTAAIAGTIGTAVAGLGSLAFGAYNLYHKRAEDASSRESALQKKAIDATSYGRAYNAGGVEGQAGYDPLQFVDPQTTDTYSEPISLSGQLYDYQKETDRAISSIPAVKPRYAPPRPAVKTEPSRTKPAGKMDVDLRPSALTMEMRVNRDIAQNYARVRGYQTIDTNIAGAPTSDLGKHGYSPGSAMENPKSKSSRGGNTSQRLTYTPTGYSSTPYTSRKR